MSENSPQPKATDLNARSKRIKHLCFLVWAAIGIILLIAGAVYALGQITMVLAIVALSTFIVFILRVPVAWMERHGIPRLPGSLIAYLGGFLITAIILLIFIPLIWEQTMGLIQLIPKYVNSASDTLSDFFEQYTYLLEDSNIQQIIAGAASDLSGWASEIVSESTKGAITLGVNLVTALIVSAVSLIVGFWILMDLPKIGRELRIIIGSKHEEEVLFIVSAFSRAFGGYLRGMTIAGACTGLIAGIGFYIIGLPYPAVLGLLTGLLNFIPYVGPWVAGIVVAIIGLFISPLIALLSIAITVFAEQFTDSLVIPRVMSSTVDLHPAVVLVGVIAGGALAGIVGMIVAIPLLAAAKAIYVYYFEKRTGRKLADEKGAIFKVRTHKKRKGSKDASEQDGDANSAQVDEADGTVAKTTSGSSAEKKSRNKAEKIDKPQEEDQGEPALEAEEDQRAAISGARSTLKMKAKKDNREK